MIDTLEIGGAERSLCEILAAMRDFEPVICQLYPGDALADAYRAAGIRRIAFDLPGKYNFCKAVTALRQTIRQEKPSVVVTTLFRADVVGRIAARLENRLLVSSFVSDSYSRIRADGMEWPRRAKHEALRMLDAATARLADHFVSNSHAIATSNARALGIAKRDITVIYRARNADRFVVHSGRQLPTDGPIVILSVARLLSLKRQIDIVDAMPRILEVYPRAVLKIAGEGPSRHALELRIAELGLSRNVELLGARDDVPNLLAQVHVFVSASQYEGLPGSVIEAMLAGLPIALSDIEVHREMDTLDAPIRFFPLHQPERIAQAVLAILSRYDFHAQQAEARSKWATVKFDLETVVSQHEVLYRQLVAGIPHQRRV